MAITRSSAIGTERLRAPHYHGRHAANSVNGGLDVDAHAHSLDITSTMRAAPFVIAAQRAATSDYYNGKRHYHGYSPDASSRLL